MKRQFKAYIVVDLSNNQILFRGRRRDAERFWYPYYVYEHKFHIVIYRTNENL